MNDAPIGGLSLNVCHAPWIDERRATMNALRESLGVRYMLDDTPAGPGEPQYETPLGPYYEEITRGKHWVWHQLQLEWSAAQPVEWCFFTQDDATIAPRDLFWRSLAAMCAGVKQDVICLHNGHPAARGLFMQGESGYTSCDQLVGQFYGMRRHVVDDLIKWRLDELVRDGTMWAHGEDSLTALFCLDRQLKIFHPLPTLFDHDLGIASTNGPEYETHLYRAPQVCWYDAPRAQHEIRWNDPEWWARPAQHVGRFYENLGTWAPLMLRDKSRAQAIVERYAADETPRRFRRYFHRLSA